MCTRLLKKLGGRVTWTRRPPTGFRRRDLRQDPVGADLSGFTGALPRDASTHAPGMLVVGLDTFFDFGAEASGAPQSRDALYASFTDLREHYLSGMQSFA